MNSFPYSLNNLCQYYSKYSILYEQKYLVYNMPWHREIFAHSSENIRSIVILPKFEYVLKFLRGFEVSATGRRPTAECLATARRRPPSRPSDLTACRALKRPSEPSEAHNFVKTYPNWAYEMFFGIYRKCRCQKTSHNLNLDDF